MGREKDSAKVIVGHCKTWVNMTWEDYGELGRRELVFAHRALDAAELDVAAALVEATVRLRRIAEAKALEDNARLQVELHCLASELRPPRRVAVSRSATQYDCGHTSRACARCPVEGCRQCPVCCGCERAPDPLLMWGLRLPSRHDG